MMERYETINVASESSHNMIRDKTHVQNVMKKLFIFIRNEWKDYKSHVLT